MTFEAAYQKALRDVAALSPYVAAAKSGAEFDGEKFRLPFFDRTFFISHPQVEVREPEVDAPPPRHIELLLLHYLVCADGAGVADSWIAYRHLPGANLFEARFNERAIKPLAATFGRDLEAFKEAGLALKGMPMSRTGDAAFRFLAFPRLPLATILYLGDEDMPSSVNFLFDEAAPHYLPTEDLSVVGGYLTGALCRHQASGRG